MSPRAATRTKNELAEVMPASMEDMVPELVDPSPSALYHAKIAEAAYFRAEGRGFAPGHEMDDWITAESELNARVVGPER